MSQRTPKQAYQRILDAVNLGTCNPVLMKKDTGAISCQYIMTLENGHRLNCGVGSLFNCMQLADIRERGLNTRPIDAVAESIGRDNIEHVTGLDLRSLLELQRAHDQYSFTEFFSYVKEQYALS